MIDVQPGWLLRLGSLGLVLALVLLAHVIAEFVLQTDRMLMSGRSWRPLTIHGVVVASVHMAFLAPVATAQTIVLILALGAAHVGIDAAHVRTDGRERRRSPAHTPRILGGTRRRDGPSRRRRRV